MGRTLWSSLERVIMADWKPEHVSSSSLIQLEGTNFQNMHSVDDLRSIQAGASSVHRAWDAPVTGGKVSDGYDPPPRRVNFVSPVRIKTMIFSSGAKVQDNKKDKKGVIIQMNAGYTQRTHTPVHRVADKQGNSWLAKQTDLDLLY